MEKLLNPSTIISALLGVLISILTYMYKKDMDDMTRVNSKQWELIRELRRDLDKLDVDPDEVDEAIRRIDRNEERSKKNEAEIGDLFDKYDAARADAFNWINRHDE